MAEEGLEASDRNKRLRGGLDSRGQAGQQNSAGVSLETVSSLPGLRTFPGNLQVKLFSPHAIPRA